MRNAAFYLFTVFGGLILSSAASAQLDDFGIQPRNVTSFKYGDDVQEIWGALSNTNTSPLQWQFRYAPLFVPEVDVSGKINTNLVTLPNSHVIVQVPIVLDNDKARALALAALSQIYPADQSKQLQAGNVYALNVGNISFTISNLDRINPQDKIANSPVSFATLVSVRGQFD
jgi:hypothetical protein